MVPTPFVVLIARQTIEKSECHISVMRRRKNDAFLTFARQSTKRPKRLDQYCQGPIGLYWGTSFARAPEIERSVIGLFWRGKAQRQNYRSIREAVARDIYCGIHISTVVAAVRPINASTTAASNLMNRLFTQQPYSRQSGCAMESSAQLALPRRQATC
jgi:hypothetical protein